MEDMTPTFFMEMSAEAPTPQCPATKSRLSEDMPIAMAYVPVQFWEKTYDPLTGLSRGTIFPALDKPFIGEEAVNDARK